MKISEATYRTSTIRFNLLNSYPGKAGKGDKFPLSKAKSRARAFLPLLKGRTVLLLGVNTSKAFGLKLPLMTWTQAKGMTVAVLPHPSGICRWWNEEKNRQAASAFLIQALAGR